MQSSEKLLPAILDGSFFNVMRKQDILSQLKMDSVARVKLENPSEKDEINLGSTLLLSDKDINEEFRNFSYLGPSPANFLNSSQQGHPNTNTATATNASVGNISL